MNILVKNLQEGVIRIYLHVFSINWGFQDAGMFRLAAGIIPLKVCLLRIQPGECEMIGWGSGKGRLFRLRARECTGVAAAAQSTGHVRFERYKPGVRSSYARLRYAVFYLVVEEKSF